MSKNRQTVARKYKVSIRVLFSESDYQSLVKLADIERTDISSIVRRAVALQYSLPPNESIKNSPKSPIDPASTAHAIS